MLESSSYEQPRIGEVLPAVARVFLEQLGIWQAFRDERFRSVHSTLTAWGQPSLSENHFIYSTHGAGWHLARSRFDAFLANQTAQKGVELLLKTRLMKVSRVPDGWHLQLSNGTEFLARFVVDATGRRAVFARKMGAKSLWFDRLTAFAHFLTLDNDPKPGTLIETFSDGWWYTTLTGERRIITCLTDSDLAQKLQLGNRDRWMKLLNETQWIQHSIGNGFIEGKPIICAANSTRLDPVCEQDWLAVGDAASAYDPLSSQGIIKAFRSGIFASYAINDILCKSNPIGLRRYEKFIQREFSSYRRTHLKYSVEEQRWSDSIFWRRRHQF